MDKLPSYHQKSKKLIFSGNLLKKKVILAIIGLITLLLSLNGCSPVGYIKQVSQATVASTRKEGDKMVYGPERTQEQYACASAKRVILQLEEVQILPEVVSSGKEINHRIRYALCPFPRTEILGGDIIRVVRFDQREVFRDVAFYQFKPGTWTVDAFIGIPKEARGGIYTIETTIKYKKLAINDRKSITVVEK